VASHYGKQFLNEFEESLEIRPSYVPDMGIDHGYTEIIHQSIPVALGQHISRDESSYREIFDIETVSRVLTEGYKFDNGVTTEDFAITSSENGGELVIGQVVSCDGKEAIGGKPFDFIQAENFERRLSSDANLERAIKELYTVRTNFDPREVVYMEKEIKKQLQEEGKYDLDIKIIRLERPEEIKWSQANSLLHDN